MITTLLVETDLEEALGEVGLRTAHDVFALGADPAWSSVRSRLDLPVRGTCGTFFFKAYRYPSWRKSRGLLGRGTLWGRAPEVQEYLGLVWLRQHGISTVRPVLAASHHVRGRLVAHALLTEWVPDAVDLEAALAGTPHASVATRDAQYALALGLGRQLAQMHLHGFAHRDCHARNILVRTGRSAPEIWFLDCRRGGRTRRRAPLLRDLACLRLDLRAGPQARFSASAWTHLLQTYLGSVSGTATLDAKLERIASREAARQAIRRARRARRARSGDAEPA